LLTPSQLKAAELLSEGRTQADVARQLGIATKTVERWKKKPEFQQAVASPETRQEIERELKKQAELIGSGSLALAAITPKTKTEMRLDELGKLNMAENAIMERVEAGDLRAIALFLKISERRCKLFGLDLSTIPVLDAVQVLVSERMITSYQARLIVEGVEGVEKKIKDFEMKQAKILDSGEV